MIGKGRETAFGQFGQRSVSRELGIYWKTKSSPVAGSRRSHGARDGRALERAQGAAGAEGRRATAQDDAQALPGRNRSDRQCAQEFTCTVTISV